MKNQKQSLYLTLGIIIITTVSIIMSINATYNYVNTKNKIINDMKNNSRTTILSLKNNVTNLLASYAINEYDKLITNEIERRKIFAIVVKDFNMGKITGKKAYISGKIRSSSASIINYDASNVQHNEQLDNCFFSDTFDIVLGGKKLGTISIYISDETMNKELRQIIIDTFKNTAIISLLMILVLFLTIRSFILRPISDITDIITKCDKDGLPIQSIPNSGSKEINSLTLTMNTMINSIKDSRLVLKESESKLFQALEIQTTIFDSSGYMMIRTNKDGIIQQLNKEAQKLLGYSSDELIDIHTPQILHLKSEIIHKSKELTKELSYEIKPNFDLFVAMSNLSVINEHEWTYVTKQGKHIPVFLSISALKNKENEIYGYLGIAKDISERKLIESQSRLASMGEMIGNIAHQWRQPLSVISTIASGVKLRSEMDNLDESHMRQDMHTIMKQSQYLSDTIDDFKNFVKNTNDIDQISISGTIEKALSIIKPSLKNHDITTVLDLKDDLTISGFENQLIQVIINITSNAKDAIKECVSEKEDKYIFVETKSTKEGLSLYIKDNGGGIEETVMHRIFEPYFTTKHQSIGTGIGLSMVHQILTQNHNASIEVYNETFKFNEKEYTGACFQITFKPD